MSKKYSNKKTSSSDIYISNVYVKESPGRGRGVFALRDIKENEMVEVAPVIVMSLSDFEMVDHTILSNYTFGLPGEAEERSVMALGYASLYNHKDNCNCDYLINEKVIKIFALRDIAKDEELFIFYGEDWAEGRDIPNWVK